MPSALPRRAFDALGNQTRREILQLLRGGPTSVGRLAGRLPVSRPAVSQHLRVLERAHLVRCEPRGRTTVVELRTDGLVAAMRWLDGLWPEALARFAALADATWRER
jgi:DNA-binding transcriptional ArsR family regulator